MAFTPQIGKRNRIRHEDAIAQLDDAQFVQLVADTFRGQGYAVQPIEPTDASSGEDGASADLLLQQGRDVILLRCKHNRLYQVTQKPLQMLMEALPASGANSAMLVASGEFTRQARDEAARHTRLLLVDGNDLRRMLKPAAPPQPPRARGADLPLTDTGQLHVDPAFANAYHDPFASSATRRWRRWGPPLVGGLIVLVTIAALLVWHRVRSTPPPPPVVVEPAQPLLPPNEGPDPEVERAMQLEHAQAIARERLQAERRAHAEEEAKKADDREQRERDRKAIEAIPAL